MSRRWKLLLVLIAGGMALQGVYAQTQQPLTLQTEIRFPADRKPVEIPFRIFRQWIVIPVRVNESRELSFILDTGALHALSLDPQLLNGSKLGANAILDTIVGWGANGPVRGDFARVDALHLGEYLLKGVVTSFPSNLSWSRLGAPSADLLQGNLGNRVLQRFHLFIDCPHSRIILERNETFPEPFAFNTTGLRFAPWAPGSEALEVAAVFKGSPAEAAGIKPGDLVTTLGGRPVSGFAVNDIEALLEQTPGGELVLTVKRGSETQDRKLRPARLL